MAAFVEDLRTGSFRASLRIKRVQRASGIYELTWSMGAGPAGRATWQYGPARRPGTPHVIWRRSGTHDILTGPWQKALLRAWVGSWWARPDGGAADRR